MTNDKSLVLTMDFGTQSLRTALVNKKGETVAMDKATYRPVYISPKPGTCEQRADYYYEVLIDSLKRLTAANQEKLGDIVAATVSTFRDTAVLLDENNKPVRNTILWLDQRMAKASEKIPAIYTALFNLVGMKDTIKLNRSRTVAHWIKENEPEIWAKVHKYVNISSYLTYKITGNLCDSAASMIGHYPINFKKAKWYGEKAMKAVIYGVKQSMLCELKEPGSVLGTITDDFAKEAGLPIGIKMIATGSDKACETIGLGALSRDTAAVSYGTASTVEVSNQKYHEPEPFLPAYPSAIPGWHNMEVQIYRGYWMLTWFTQNFAIELIDESKSQRIAVEEILNEDLSKIPPGSDGLVLQPYWGPGLRRPLAKGGIIGFSDIHTREHLYRAIIEGIGYALREGLDSIQKSQKHKVKEIRISGGGSKSDTICQITADIFGLPVSKVQTSESTTLGAAIACFVATKEFDGIEDATKAMVHITKTFYPNPDNVAKYDKLYKDIYLNLYPKLKKVYKDLNKITKRYN